jgi:hypothetical protein
MRSWQQRSSPPHFALGVWWLARRIGGTELTLGFLGLCCALLVLFLVALPGTEYVWFGPPGRRRGRLALGAPATPGPRAGATRPAAIAIVLVAPLILNSCFPAGVASLPLPTLLDAFAAGAFIAPALT